MRRFLIIAAVLVLAGCAGYLAGCAVQTATTSPVYPSPSAMLTELPPVNWSRPQTPGWPTPIQLGTPVPPADTPGVKAMLPVAWRCACETPTPTATSTITPTATLTPTLTPTPTPSPEMTIRDCTGAITTTGWLTATFGAVDWDGYSLDALSCSIGPAVLVAHVTDLDREPLENATVVLHWPDAPMLPLELRSCGLDRGVYGPTNQNGDIGFGLGAGSYYWPPAAGPHTMWVIGGDSCVYGLGMIGGTNHQHLDSGWWLEPSIVAASGWWGYSPGSIVDQVEVGGRLMWVIRAP